MMDPIKAQLAAALAELIACKELKDLESKLRGRRIVSISRNKAKTAEVDRMRRDYNERKPKAWAAARAALVAFLEQTQRLHDNGTET